MFTLYRPDFTRIGVCQTMRGALLAKRDGVNRIDFYIGVRRTGVGITWDDGCTAMGTEPRAAFDVLADLRARGLAGVVVEHSARATLAGGLAPV